MMRVVICRSPMAFLTDLSMITPPVYELTRRGVSTAQGGKWSAGKVINVRKRLAVVS